MTSSPRDDNRIPAWVALSYIDGTTVVPIAINSSTGGFITDGVHSISFTPSNEAVRDDNRYTFLMGTSSVDGSPIPAYADPVTGALLVDII